MSFPGSISSFIQIADNALLRPANITISCWVNVTGGASLNTFVHKALSPCVNDSWYAGTESVTLEPMCLIQLPAATRYLFLFSSK
jgi:hypothetical protein